MNFNNVSPRSQRILIWIALGLATIYALSYYFLLKFWPPPGPELSSTEVVKLYTSHNLQFRVGCVLMILSGAFYFPWSVVLSVQMARDENRFPIWALVQALGSAVATWFFMFPPVLWGVAAFNTSRDPGLTVLMNELAWLTFVTPASFFPFQMFSVAVVALSEKKDPGNSAFPRWIGWLTLWVGITGTSGTIAQVFNSGPFAWNGIFPFYIPTVIFGIWFNAQAYLLFRAISRQERVAKA